MKTIRNKFVRSLMGSFQATPNGFSERVRRSSFRSSRNSLTQSPWLELDHQGKTIDLGFQVERSEVIRHFAIHLRQGYLCEVLTDGALGLGMQLLLFHLKDDLGETTDLSKSQPEKAEELRQQLLVWQKETGAVIPSLPNPDFDPTASSVGNKKKKTKSEVAK